MIKFYFQKGDFFYSSSPCPSLLGPAITVAGLLITVVIFLRTRRIERNKKAKERLDFYDYVITLVKGSLPTLSDQIAKIDSFLEEKKLKPLKPIIFKKGSFHDFERFSLRLNLTEFYHSYIQVHGDSVESIENYRAIISSMDSILNNLNQLLELVSSLAEFENVYRERFNNNVLTGVLKEVRPFIAEINSSNIKDAPVVKEFVSSYAELFNKFFKAYEEEIKINPDFEPVKYQIDNFMIPLRELIDSNPRYQIPLTNGLYRAYSRDIPEYENFLKGQLERIDLLTYTKEKLAESFEKVKTCLQFPRRTDPTFSYLTRWYHRYF